ncbi:MAG: ribbon-helix-helix protein, CopG family [Candidatus Binataceae bacterium]
MGVITIRLDAETSASLERAARESGQTKSEVVRDALSYRLRKRKNGRRAANSESFYDRIKDLIGSCRSGGLNLSERTGDKFYEMLIEDRRARDVDRRRTASRARRS